MTGDPIHDPAVLAELLDKWPDQRTATGLWAKVRSTSFRIGLQSLHHLSNLLGDDVAGRALRRNLFRLAGADIASGAWLHGGTWISKPSNLVMGIRSGLNRNCYLDLEGRIEFGLGAGAGHGATFVTTVHPLIDALRLGPATTGPILVEPGAWIAANVVVLPGVTVGCHAVVAAGAVVTRDVAPHTIVAGVPAAPVRHGVRAPETCPVVAARTAGT